MNLWKFSFYCAVCLVALIGGLMILKGPGSFTLERIAGPRLPVGDLVSGEPIVHPADPSASIETEPGPALSNEKPGKVPTFGNGPGTPPPPSKLYAGQTNTDAQKVAAYRSAIDALTVIGCSGNQVALKIDGEGGPKTVRSGASVRFAGGLDLAVRIVDSSRCRVVLTDHGRSVGEAASF